MLAYDTDPLKMRDPDAPPRYLAEGAEPITRTQALARLAVGDYFMMTFGAGSRPATVVEVDDVGRVFVRPGTVPGAPRRIRPVDAVEVLVAFGCSWRR